MTTTNAIRMGDGLRAALHADGAHPALARELQLFGQFVGSWLLDWAGIDAAGKPASMTGELHVGWVLGGRAVQDVWIVPGRGQPDEGRPPLAFHGSTIRFFDPGIGAWRSTWIEPVNGRVRRFIGCPTDEGILLLSDEMDPHLRWRLRRSPPTCSAGTPRAPPTAASLGSSTKRCAPLARDVYS